MKNHKTKLLLASLLVVGTIASTPFVSFAQSNDNNYKTNNGNHRGILTSLFARNGNSSGSNSIWNRMGNWNWFVPQWAHANNDSDNNGGGTSTPTPVVKNQTPSISSITAPTVLKAGETGTWKVSASDPQNGSLTYAVNWGDQAMQPLAMTAQPIFTQDSSFTHAYDTAGTYTVTFTVSNAAGLKTTSTVTVHVTGTVQDKNAPVITSLDGNKTVVAGATETVTVNAYDPKNGSLTYAADWGDTASTLRAMAAIETPFTQSASFSHIYDAAGTYTATFTAQNAAGKKATSTMKITVTAADTTGPIITGVSAKDITAAGGTVAWTTDEPSTSRVYYSTTTPVDTSKDSSVFSSTASTDHSLSLSGLKSSTLYHFIVEAIDALGNKSVSSESSFTTSAQ